MFEVTAELWYNCTIIIVHVEDHYFEDLRRIASMKNLLTNLLLFASIVILFS